MLKKISFLFFILIIINSCVFATGEYYQSDYYQENDAIIRSIDYYIDSYKINAKVNKNKTVDFKEEIGVMFYNQQERIVRKIPIDKYNSIKNITVSGDYNITIEENEDVVSIIIESGKKYFSSQQYFTIEYTYDFGKDLDFFYDYLAFYIVDNMWDVSVSNISYRIELPEIIDEADISFSGILFDSEKNNYSIDGNVIKGDYEIILNPNNSIQVSFDLPDNYFKNETIFLNYPALIVFVVPAIFLIFTVFSTFCKRKRNDLDEDLSGGDSFIDEKNEMLIKKYPWVKTIIFIAITLITIFSVVAYEAQSIMLLFSAIGLSLFYIPFYAVGMSKIWGNVGCMKVFWLGFTMFHSGVFYLSMLDSIFDFIIKMGYIFGGICVLIMLLLLNYQINKKE